MSSPDRLPVVLCGRSPAIGKPVAELLQPEYEVIHFIQSIEEAESFIPPLLAGLSPPFPAQEDVGTHDYSVAPCVVIFGRGYSPDQVEELRRGCMGRANRPVAWIVGHPSDAPTGPPGPGYAQVVADQVKTVIARWENDGARQDEIIFY